MLTARLIAQNVLPSLANGLVTMMRLAAVPASALAMFARRCRFTRLKLSAIGVRPPPGVMMLCLCRRSTSMFSIRAVGRDWGGGVGLTVSAGVGAATARRPGG